MKPEIINSSIVVLGPGYSPTMLNPDFLKNTGIVDKNWELDDSPITTPVLSMVKYTNSIVFTTEPNKIQIRNNNPQKHSDISLIPRLASKYIQKFNYVRHTAIGINLVGFINHYEPKRFLLDNIVKSGAWISPELDAASVKLIYQYPEYKLSLSVDSGEVTFADETDRQQGLIFSGNFHKDIPSRLGLEEINLDVIGTISQYESYRESFFNLVARFFPLGDDQ